MNSCILFIRVMVSYPFLIDRVLTCYLLPALCVAGLVNQVTDPACDEEFKYARSIGQCCVVAIYTALSIFVDQ